MKDRSKSIAVKILFVIVALIAWECFSKSGLLGSRTEFLIPPIEEIAKAFIRVFSDGYAGTSLMVYTLNSLKLLLEGLLIGLFLAFLFSGLSIVSKTFQSIYELVVLVCDLLPGVALLPVVIVIFGINTGVIVFLVVHAVLWPMSKNLCDGFKNVPQIYIESGKNIGLSSTKLLVKIYIPATAGYILSGLKVGWARAWRGLLSAEMIFGIASCPGIGLFINQMRTNMNNAEMYATIIVIILIGLIVQYLILEPIEKCTVRRWGMMR